MSEESQSPRIMIVDDETKNIQVLGTLLQQKGYYIYVAQNGKEALEIIKEVLPDLILLDIMMPEPDGFEVCRLLKKEAKTKDIPVIFLTVKSDSSDIIRGFILGAADYVTKPFNSVELLARINTHLNLKIPAAKSRLMDAPVRNPNIIMGIEGGITTPMEPPDA
ncbi:response regulator [Desulfobacterales bacterium HSG17]|nr:response regulator [Desulfobacterales bacterium HSG17]